MTNDSKTYIVNDQPPTNGEIDALDFMPYVETLADIIQTGDTPLRPSACSACGAHNQL